LFISLQKKKQHKTKQQTCSKQKAPVVGLLLSQTNLSNTKVTTSGLFLAHSWMNFQSEAAGRGIIFKPCIFTESQNVRGWKGPLAITWSNPPAKAGSPTAGCTGPRPGFSCFCLAPDSRLAPSVTEEFSQTRRRCQEKTLAVH